MIGALRRRSPTRCARRCNVRSSSTGCGRSPPASAPRERPRTAPPARKLRAAPVSRCARPSRRAAAGPDPSNRRSKSSTPSAAFCCANCKPPSRCRNSRSTISRWSRPTAAPLSRVEALLRWTHPSRGPIAPSVFIPLAEQAGLMSQLGEIVLRRALTDAARWPNLSVAVNLSPLQIRDRWIVDLVAVRHGGDRHRVLARRTGGDRRHPDRQSAGSAGPARSVARARRQHRARRFRHRLFELELSAKISLRPASRSTAPSSARSAPPAAPAPSSSRSSRSVTRSA